MANFSGSSTSSPTAVRSAGECPAQRRGLQVAPRRVPVAGAQVGVWGVGFSSLRFAFSSARFTQILHHSSGIARRHHYRRGDAVAQSLIKVAKFSPAKCGLQFIHNQSMTLPSKSSAPPEHFEEKERQEEEEALAKPGGARQAGCRGEGEEEGGEKAARSGEAGASSDELTRFVARCFCATPPPPSFPPFSCCKGICLGMDLSHISGSETRNLAGKSGK